MSYRKCASIMITAAALGLAACSTTPPRTVGYPDTHPAYPAVQATYGYVDAVEVVPGNERPGGIGIGAIGGAIAGGVLGNQIGRGDGRAVATIGGAVAGGVIGNEIQKRVQPTHPTMYRYRVRMDDGSYQTFTQEADAQVRAGDRVRVENGRVWGS